MYKVRLPYDSFLNSAKRFDLFYLAVYNFRAIVVSKYTCTLRKTGKTWLMAGPFFLIPCDFILILSKMVWLCIIWNIVLNHLDFSLTLSSLCISKVSLYLWIWVGYTKFMFYCNMKKSSSLSYYF